MMTDQIEKLEDEADEWRRIAQRRADKMEVLKSELENIANASPKKWGMPLDEFQEEFHQWAQSRARHAISEANVKGLAPATGSAPSIAS